MLKYFNVQKPWFNIKLAARNSEVLQAFKCNWKRRVCEQHAVLVGCVGKSPHGNHHAMAAVSVVLSTGKCRGQGWDPLQPPQAWSHSFVQMPGAVGNAPVCFTWPPAAAAKGQVPRAPAMRLLALCRCLRYARTSQHRAPRFDPD